MGPDRFVKRIRPLVLAILPLAAAVSACGDNNPPIEIETSTTQAAAAKTFHTALEKKALFQNARENSKGIVFLNVHSQDVGVSGSHFRLQLAKIEHNGQRVVVDEAEITLGKDSTHVALTTRVCFGEYQISVLGQREEILSMPDIKTGALNPTFYLSAETCSRNIDVDAYTKPTSPRSRSRNFLQNPESPFAPGSPIQLLS